MNIAISEVCKQVSDAKKGKIEIRPAIPFVPESTVESDWTNKNKDEFISTILYHYQQTIPEVRQ